MKKSLLILVLLGLCAGTAFATDKSWNNEGNQTDWVDGANWVPTGVPGTNDSVTIDYQNTQVGMGQPFEIKSLIVGGKKNSELDINNFVNATIDPDSPDNNALLVRSEGKISIKGSGGKIVVKGTYIDSEELVPEEPGLMLYVK